MKPSKYVIFPLLLSQESDSGRLRRRLVFLERVKLVAQRLLEGGPGFGAVHIGFQVGEIRDKTRVAQEAQAGDNDKTADRNPPSQQFLPPQPVRPPPQLQLGEVDRPG